MDEQRILYLIDQQIAEALNKIKDNAVLNGDDMVIRVYDFENALKQMGWA